MISELFLGINALGWVKPPKGFSVTIQGLHKTHGTVTYLMIRQLEFCSVV
jgi:hypothetical protein